MEERRRHPRISHETFISGASGEYYIIKDISVGGMRYLSPHEPTEQFISLALPGAGKTLTLPTKPVWSRQTKIGKNYFEVGASFSALSRADQQALPYVVHALEYGQSLEDISFKPQSLTEDTRELEQLVEKIRTNQLDTTILPCIEACRQISPRPLYLWQWCHEGLLRTTLTSVSSKWLHAVQTIKLYSIIFAAIVDDLADKINDGVFFAHVLSNVFGLAPDGRQYISETQRQQTETLKQMWQFICDRIMTFPRYADFKHIFFFDYETLIHQAKYAFLINRNPSVICEKEGRIEQAYGTQIMNNANFDLLCSEDFDVNELGPFREIVLEAQEMCGIANWIATWEREVDVSDFTSGVIATALRRKVVTIPELCEAKENKEIQLRVKEKIKNSDVETNLLALWEHKWHFLDAKRHSIGSVNVEQYLEGIEDFLKIQIASRGLI